MTARVLLVFALAFRALAEPNLNADLFRAIRANSVESVKSLLGRGAEVDARDRSQATPLMHAALYASPECVRLLLDKGADVNAKNGVGATALMWGAGDAAKVRLLVDKGADVNARAAAGRTPLIIASACRNNAASVKLLLEKGADVKARDRSRGGPVAAAAMVGDVAILRELLAHGADPEEPTRAGMTALMSAAQGGSFEAVKLLLAGGADVNRQSLRQPPVKAGLQERGELTALLLAASMGSPEIVQALLAKGAEVNVKDMRGMTPLMMAASAEKQNAETVRLLLAKGAEVNVRSNDNETALSWANKWGDTEIVRLLKEAGATAPAKAPGPDPEKRLAIPVRQHLEKTMALLQASSTEYFNKSGCVGCHHQMLTGLAVAVARDKGIAVNEKLAQEQLKTVTTLMNANRESLLQRVHSGGAPMTHSLTLISMAAQKHPSDETTDAAVHNIAGDQGPDGAWHSQSMRPPLEYSTFSETAYSIRALTLYAPEGLKPEIQRRIERARQWLLVAAPQSNEERAMQLLGLGWSGAPKDRIGKLAAELVRQQRSDGGWAQLATLPSDAYATGQALTALRWAAGTPATDAAYRRGLAYLAGTWRNDGSWYVPSRSVKFQPYFESGFPHGHDQWISAAATAWSAIALSLSLD